MSSSKKNPEAERIGGPGSSQQNQKHPEKSAPKKSGNPNQSQENSSFSNVSGGGGESDVHHERNTHGKAGR